MAVVSITVLLLTFITSSFSRQYTQELEERLIYQEKMIETLLRLLQQPCYLINPHQTQHDIPRSVLAMTVQQNMADIQMRGRNRLWRGTPMYRFANDKKPEKSNESNPGDSSKEEFNSKLDNSFYKALSKVLRKEINRRPQLQKVIGHDIEKINIGGPDGSPL